MSLDNAFALIEGHPQKESKGKIKGLSHPPEPQKRSSVKTSIQRIWKTRFAWKYCGLPSFWYGLKCHLPTAA